jgi:hypothetical protein
MTHLESLSQTDSQALKRAELEGFFKKWLQAKYPLHLAIYLDILQPVKVFSLAMQQESHDPALQVKHINEFGWTMLKLNALLTESIDKNTSRLTNYTKFLKEVKCADGSYEYQEIKLLNFDGSSERINKSYSDVISCLTAKMNERFEDLQTHPVFKGMSILDCSRWPRDDLNLFVYGEKEIDALSKHFSSLLSNNGCDIDKIMTEWDLLKLEVNMLIFGCCSIEYLDVWQQVFTLPDRKSFENVLHIIELLQFRFYLDFLGLGNAHNMRSAYKIGSEMGATYLLKFLRS